MNTSFTTSQSQISGTATGHEDLFLSQVVSNATSLNPSQSIVLLGPSGTSTTFADGQHDFENTNPFGNFMPIQNSQQYAYTFVGPFNLGGNASHCVYSPLSIYTTTPDIWLELCMDNGKPLYKCTWPNCAVKPATKAKMHTHVHSQHFGITKLYQCTWQFGSLASAKRHSDTQTKKFRCGVCHKMFARKDYRNVHRKRCTTSLFST